MGSKSSTLNYGLGAVKFDPSAFGSIDAVWKEHAVELGGESDRAMTFKAGDSTVSGDTAPRAGTAYFADVKLGDKGSD